MKLANCMLQLLLITLDFQCFTLENLVKKWKLSCLTITLAISAEPNHACLYSSPLSKLYIQLICKVEPTFLHDMERRALIVY